MGTVFDSKRKTAELKLVTMWGTFGGNAPVLVKQ